MTQTDCTSQTDLSPFRPSGQPFSHRTFRLAGGTAHVRDLIGV